MTKLITVFCESFEDDKVLLFDSITSRFDFEYTLMFVALTPLACYQLEALDIEYTTVEMYCAVQEEVFDPSRQLNTRLKVFSLYDFEKQRVKRFWNNFLNSYMDTMYRDKPPYFIYFGKPTMGLADELSSNKRLSKIPNGKIDLP